MSFVSRAYLFLSVFLAAAVVTGCGGSKKPLREIPEDAYGPISTEIPAYESEQTTARLREYTDRFEKLANTFRGALDKESHGFVSHDPALDVIAMLQLHSFGGNEALAARSLARWMMWKLGVTGTYIGTSAWAGSGRYAKKQLSDALASAGRDFDAEQKRYSFGVARLKIGNNTYAQALVWVKKNVLLYDFPKHYSPGEDLVLRGKILVSFQNPEFYMDLSQTEVLEKEIEAEDDGLFVIKVTAPETPGRHFIEVLVSEPPGEDGTDEDDDWHSAVLMLPIYVQTKEPEKPDEMIRKPPENPPDKKQWPHRVVEHYNRERKKAGLGPLRLHEGARGLARIQAAGLLADEDPSGELELLMLLTKEGIDVDNVLQARGYLQYVDERVWLHLLSPSHRQMIFDPNTTLVGIDFEQDEPYSYGYHEYLITEATPEPEEEEKEETEPSSADKEPPSATPPDSRDGLKK